MSLLFWLSLACLGSVTVLQGQGNPCHCLSFELDFYKEAEDLAFVPIESYEQEGKQVQVYQEQNFGNLTAVAVLSHSPEKSSPILERLEWQAKGQSSIGFHAAWNFDLKTAYRERTAFAKRHQKSLADLHPFSFLPPMDSELQLQVYLVDDYQKGQGIPQDNRSMKVQVTIPAHPFYSDWNSLSPFKMKTPYLKVKLAYIEGYQWTVTIENGVKIIQNLTILEKSTEKE